LIPEGALHEYVGRSTLVELTVDEDECFSLAGDVLSLCLVERMLPLYQPLKDQETPVGIFNI
jgi:hypothetical protein